MTNIISLSEGGPQELMLYITDTESGAFFKELEAVAGPDAVAALISEFGGTRVYIPKHRFKSAEARLAKAWGGLDRANEIIRDLKLNSGFLLAIPLRGASRGAQLRAEMRKCLATGRYSVAEIAVRFRVDERTVYRNKRLMLNRADDITPP